ncbi:DMT family transporter [Desulfobulbus rhabdoformis]|uniref:DMT family transporter n=1 Tax=Desulfobulbus rhabdoformis TaxID=34032 RepID=UPI001966BDCF|nr:DMT family transporter [Desulfobulbus rhabdoformis]MBM9612666.1 DMT family transporter [Desulfobulbus rhabdoformis]
MTQPSASGGVPSRLLLHSAMLFSTFLVSTSFTVGKAITPTLDPVILTLLRFILASLLFAPYVQYRFDLHFPGWRALGRYSLISGALVGFFWLMFLSLRITEPMNTGVIFTTVPGISGIFSWFLVRERLGTHRLLALILAMTGALYVIFEGNLDRLLALQLNQGDLLFFAGCLLMALYMPMVKLFHRGEPMAQMSLWIMVTGTIWLLLFSLPRFASITWSAIPLMTWTGIAYLALFTTIITFFISQWATLHLGPTRVMAYSYLYPPLLAVLEWVLHRRFPPASTLTGICIILPAMFIVQQSRTGTKKS